MRKTLLIILPLLLIVGYAQNLVDETLIDKDGLKYHPDTNELYSGKVFKNRMGGKKEFEGSYKDGKKDGLWTDYYKNGQKSSEITYKNGREYIIRTYKDGEREGLWTWWYGNGQKFYEDIYKDGELIESKKWDRDGNLIED
jgi:antitoxin component YwqK of YwqJK toxin-antitoxin module